MNRLRERVPDSPKAKVGICLNPNVDRAVRSIVEGHWYFRGLSHFYEFAAARLVEAVDRGDRIFEAQKHEENDPDDCSKPKGARYPICENGPSPLCKWCSNDSECGKIMKEWRDYQQ